MFDYFKNWLWIKPYSSVKYVAPHPIQIRVFCVCVIGLCFRLKVIMVQQMPFMILWQTDVVRKHMRSASIRVTFLQHNSDYTEVYRRKNRQSGGVYALGREWGSLPFLHTLTHNALRGLWKNPSHPECMYAFVSMTSYASSTHTSWSHPKSTLLHDTEVQ